MVDDIHKDLEHLQKLAGNAERFVTGGQTELAAWTLRNLAQTATKVLEVVEKDLIAGELHDLTDPEEPSVDRG